MWLTASQQGTGTCTRKGLGSGGQRQGSEEGITDKRGWLQPWKTCPVAMLCRITVQRVLDVIVLPCAVAAYSALGALYRVHCTTVQLYRVRSECHPDVC